MKVSHYITIDKSEASALLADLNELVNVFSANERDLKKEFPALMQLKSLCDGIVISEPRQRVFEKIDDADRRQAQAKPKRRLKSVDR